MCLGVVLPVKFPLTGASLCMRRQLSHGSQREMSGGGDREFTSKAQLNTSINVDTAQLNKSIFL